MSEQQCPHYTSTVTCEKCGNEWVAVHPVTGNDCEQLECPNCGHMQWVGLLDPRPTHLILSEMNGAMWIKPSRAVPAYRVVAMLESALQMIKAEESPIAVLDPADCTLNAMLVIDNEQKVEDE